MKLRHSTTARALASIVRRGLDPRRSKQGRLAVWLHSPRLTAWACMHTSKRHNVPIDAVITLEVDVPRSWVKKHASGLYYCFKEIPPERFGRVLSYSLVAR